MFNKTSANPKGQSQNRVKAKVKKKKAMPRSYADNSDTEITKSITITVGHENTPKTKQRLRLTEKFIHRGK